MQGGENHFERAVGHARRVTAVERIRRADGDGERWVAVLVDEDRNVTGSRAAEPDHSRQHFARRNRREVEVLSCRSRERQRRSDRRNLGAGRGVEDCDRRVGTGGQVDRVET